MGITTVMTRGLIGGRTVIIFPSLTAMGLTPTGIIMDPVMGIF
jgi:hypothetical protein